MINYNLLDKKLNEKGISDRKFCESIGRSHAWYCRAKKRKMQLKMSDVQKICDFMGFDVPTRMEIFFAPDVAE